MASPYGHPIPTTEMSPEYIIFWNQRSLYMGDHPHVIVQIREADNYNLFMVEVNGEYRFLGKRDHLFGRTKELRKTWILFDPDFKEISRGLDPNMLVQTQIDLIEALICPATEGVQ